MSCDLPTVIEVAPAELGESLAAVRLSAPGAQQQMQLSLARVGQLTPMQASRERKRLALGLPKRGRGRPIELTFSDDLETC